MALSESTLQAGEVPVPVDVQSLRGARRLLALMFAGVPLALVALIWASFRLTAAIHAVDRSHEAIDVIVNARAATRQSRQALHAYLQSADAEQLTNYERAVQLAWSEAWRFKEMTLDNPRQKGNAQRFEQRLHETFRLGDDLLAEKKAQKPRGLEARYAAEEATSDGLRKAVSDLVDEERRQLTMNEAQLSVSVRALQVLSVLFALVTLYFGFRSWKRVDKLLSLLKGPEAP